MLAFHTLFLGIQVA